MLWSAVMSTFTLVYAAASIGVPILTLGFCLLGQKLSAH